MGTISGLPEEGALHLHPHDDGPLGVVRLRQGRVGQGATGTGALPDNLAHHDLDTAPRPARPATWLTQARWSLGP